MYSIQEIVQYVCERQVVPSSSDFSGFGAVFYRGSIADLPVTPLTPGSELGFPEGDVSKIADLLFAVSRYSDDRHDGFHFVHESLGLTHFAQFFSPPIPKGYAAKRYGVGARYRAAELGALIENVVAVLIVGKDGKVIVFQDGEETTL
ncbi:hypothetical protein ASF04_25515 [Duganella sp. Leaf61]|uniref:hypothetical protein n=1 Tax=Duganella sp. Leaf61 TaxID=1736227 RepID=UPI0006FB755B|nr:hypothetical protein [Duganella sp. Leaf61]KQN76358.1 hypothetical protein ASF04_25515 [Duganella sp. Leaf61]